MEERKRTGLRIPYDLNTYLILKSRKLGISKNALILQIIRDWAESKKWGRIHKVNYIWTERR